MSPHDEFSPVFIQQMVSHRREKGAERLKAAGVRSKREPKTGTETEKKAVGLREK
jgi:hypothetical protein